MFNRYAYSDGTFQNKTLVCMNPFSTAAITSALTLTKTIANVRALPANCAYGLFDTEYTNSTFTNLFDNNANVALKCLQCKPGYKPIFKGGAANEGLRAVIEC